MSATSDLKILALSVIETYDSGYPGKLSRERIYGSGSRIVIEGVALAEIKKRIAQKLGWTSVETGNARAMSAVEFANKVAFYNPPPIAHRPL